MSDLRGANLLGAYLSKANLVRAHLIGADLRATLPVAELEAAMARGEKLDLDPGAALP